MLLEDVGALGRRPLVQGGAYVVRVTGVHGYDLVAQPTSDIERKVILPVIRR